jgi:RNA polymerase sigma-70 factor (ECF subfamily)
MTTAPASALDDVDLVVLCRAGDAAAWHELVERYSRYVRAIARAYCLAERDADEAFQETFRRAHEGLGELRPDESLRPWIGRLARQASGAAPGQAPTAEALARVELAMDVQAALARLPDPCRELLDRFFMRDESYHTIADALGLPPDAIASRISRCLDRLRSTWEDPAARPSPS